MKEAIILAGGLGTRLRSVVADLPKCMAPINGKPFLGYLINYLQHEGIEKFIFSVGYLSESITLFLKNNFDTLQYTISKEDEPLGTGGAILQALNFAESKHVVITNGDTLFRIHLNEAAMFHNRKEADCTLCLKPMTNFDRYGVVSLDDNGKIESFKEKQYYENGLINGGVYLLNKFSFLNEGLPHKFSFEKDYLEKYFSKRKMYGIEQQGYFIDIGIPEDYLKAQTELQMQ